MSECYNSPIRQSVLITPNLLNTYLNIAYRSVDVLRCPLKTEKYCENDSSMKSSVNFLEQIPFNTYQILNM